MRDDRLIVEDMLDAIERIEKYAARGRGEFSENELIQTWIVHHLQIVGEGARKLSLEFRSRFPGIPWKQIVAMRHILVHDYFGVDLDQVWSAVEADVPVLKGQLREALEN